MRRIRLNQLDGVARETTVLASERVCDCSCAEQPSGCRGRARPGAHPGAGSPSGAASGAKGNHGHHGVRGQPAPLRVTVRRDGNVPHQPRGVSELRGASGPCLCRALPRSERERSQVRAGLRARAALAASRGLCRRDSTGPCPELEAVLCGRQASCWVLQRRSGQGAVPGP